MCGIAGFIDSRLTGESEPILRRSRAMGDAIRHRGPDGDGTYADPRFGLGFAHRRLAIVDLSPAGAQPMTSADGRFVICYNGEVYNAEELRCDPALRDVRWRGHSDTEVIIELFAQRGIEATLRAMNGMFAIALWDRERHVLYLMRDRMGIKPLFVRDTAHGVIFGSELRALLAAEGRGVLELDTAAVASFLRFGYVPAPHSIYQEVWKVLPGEVVTVSPGAGARAQTISRSFYWTCAEAARAGTAAPLEISDAEAIERLDALLRDAVGGQMMGDVPLGAFLSGGIDSSLVVALMVAAKQGKVRTFSIGFHEAEFDESGHAAAVARHLGTEHTEFKVSADDALAVVPMLGTIYDEPFADSSQIPTYLVSKLTREHVTVALSGDGGDELFGGYNRYRFAESVGARLERIPRPLRQGLASALSAVPAELVDASGRMLPKRLRPSQLSDKLRKIAAVLPLDEDGLYRELVSQSADIAALVPGVYEHPLFEWSGRDAARLPTHLQRMQCKDMTTYLPDDILQKVDRASMAVALEARPPLLDHRVVEFAWSLPRQLKIREGETKWILRKVLDRYVPRQIVERPKMGFGVPLAAWLRGPLRDWAEELLKPSSLAGTSFDAKAVGALWQEHLSGRENRAYAIWPILVLQDWLRASR